MKYFICFFGITAIFILEIIAINHNIDGKVLAGSIGAISFIIGYNFNKKKEQKYD